MSDNGDRLMTNAVLHVLAEFTHSISIGVVITFGFMNHTANQNVVQNASCEGSGVRVNLLFQLSNIPSSLSSYSATVWALPRRLNSLTTQSGCIRAHMCKDVQAV